MFDLFITKVDENNIVKEYSIYGIEHKINIEYVQHIIVEDDYIEYANNYKLVDGKLTELTEEEKASLITAPTLEPTLEERNRADIDYILVMQGL